MERSAEVQEIRTPCALKQFTFTLHYTESRFKWIMFTASFSIQAAELQLPLLMEVKLRKCHNNINCGVLRVHDVIY